MPDYIEREKALKLIESAETWGWSNNILYDEMKNLPAADVAPVVHAKWENCDWVEPYYHGCGTIRIPNAGMKCTNCVHVFKKDLLWKDNYCPNCGAKMDLEDAE